MALHSLTLDERVAILAVLRRTQEDREARSDEEHALFRELHAKFLGTSSPEPAWPVFEAAAAGLRRPEARDTALVLLYDMARADGVTDPGERAYFMRVATLAGLSSEVAEARWTQLASDFFERASFLLVSSTVGTLADRLAELRQALGLPEDVDSVATRQVKALAAQFGMNDVA